MADATIRTRATLDNAAFKVGVAGMTQSLGALKGMVASAFGIGAVMAFGRKMLQTADDLQTAANTFGITIESMLALKAAMAESGIGADAMMRIMSRLPRAQGEVVKGNKRMVEALQSLGISQEQFVSLAPDTLLERLAVAYVATGGTAEAFNAVGAIFGERIGPQMIEVLQRIGKDGLAPFQDGVKAAADGMTTLAEASDALEKTGNKITNWGANAVSWYKRVSEAALTAAAAMGGQLSTMQKLALLVAGPLAPAILPLMLGRRGISAGIEGAKAGWGMADERAAARAAAGASSGDMSSAANLAALEGRREKEASDKRRARELLVTKRAIYGLQATEEAEAKHSERMAAIKGGAGMSAPSMAAVDSLQRIGGLIGGVSGAGSQAARVAERQAKQIELIADEVKRFAADTDRIAAKLAEMEVI